MLARYNPFRHLKFELFGRSLSGRVLWLTVSIILLVELVILMPSLGRERQAWMWEHITRAHLAGFSVRQSSGRQIETVGSGAPANILLDPATRETGRWFPPLRQRFAEPVKEECRENGQYREMQPGIKPRKNAEDGKNEKQCHNQQRRRENCDRLFEQNDESRCSDRRGETGWRV